MKTDVSFMINYIANGKAPLCQYLDHNYRIDPMSLIVKISDIKKEQYEAMIENCMCNVQLYRGTYTYDLYKYTTDGGLTSAPMIFETPNNIFFEFYEGSIYIGNKLEFHH